MTREEEIYNAINNLQIGVYDEDISSDNDEYNNDEYNGSDLQDAFYAGATWADENPKSPWISINDDLPFSYKELIYNEEISEGAETIRVIATNKRGNIWIDYMIYEDGKWRWNGFEPDFWMPIPKLHHNAAI